MRDAQDADVLASADPAAGGSRLGKAVAVAAVVVIIDQLTKWWVLNTLASGPCSQPDACIDLILGFKLNLVFNTGAAFTSGSGYGPVFAVLAFFMTGFLLYLAGKRTDRFSFICFAAIAGGAAGNLIDRVFRADDGVLNGAVIDFIDAGWWPVFNIADSAIVLGVIGVLVATALEPDPSGVDPSSDGESDDDVAEDGFVEDGFVEDGFVEDEAVDASSADDDLVDDDAALERGD